jgi:hypothetical protein
MHIANIYVSLKLNFYFSFFLLLPRYFVTPPKKKGQHYGMDKSTTNLENEV